MSTKHPEIFAALAAEFHPGDVKIKDIVDKKSGKSRKYNYIKPRTVMNRLDDVLGPENWEDNYFPFGPSGGVKCRLTITLPDGRKVTKTGIGGITAMFDPSDSEKTGESDAIKRAAVKFGVGRYLYGDGQVGFDPQGQPRKPVVEPVRDPDPPQQPKSLGPVHGDPREVEWTGKRLHDWARAEGRKVNRDLVAYLSKWGLKQGYPGQLTRWNHSQAAAGHAEGQRRLRAASQGVAS